VTALRPVVAQYEPPGHGVHAEEPVKAWYVVMGQLKHTVDDTAEYFPAAQAPVTALRPLVAQYEPPGHAVHVLDPVEA